MKKDIHPKVKNVKAICSCGTEFEMVSALKEDSIRIEICSKCHPFYTGEQKLVKTGSVDKFYERLKKTQSLGQK
jgi:large subunit ribosomal protein L31